MAADPGHPLTVVPGKVVAVHLNYASRAAERGRRPESPSYFLKPSSSVSGSDAPVERPPGTELLAFEGEIALVIGRPARRVSAGRAWAHVAWVTAANDWGLYDLRTADRGSNLRSKGRDGYTPLGPHLIDARHVDPDRLRVRTWLNGQLVQDDLTSTTLFSLPRLVADLSQHLTLDTGDVILTGTPAGASVAQPGDLVEVEVDCPGAPGAPTSGRLRSPVVAGSDTFDPTLGALPHIDVDVRADAWGAAASVPLDRSGEPGDTEATLPHELRALLVATPVAALAQQLRRRGLEQVVLEGVRSLRPGAKLVGPATTLRFVPRREDLFAEHGTGHNVQKQSFDEVGAGEVIVIEARGDIGAGTLGDILARRAAQRGAAGVVTDGAVRDSAVLAELDLPVFSHGAHPAVLGRRHVPWDRGLTVSCGGVTVQPGDVVVGDDDGVIVLPRAIAAEVARDAAQQEAEDAWIADQVVAGHSLDGLFPLDDTWRARYRAATAAPDETTEEPHEK